MKVTERLAALFMEASMRDRELLAAETDQFLGTELENARRRLVDQEKKLEAYRTKYSRQVPSQETGRGAMLGLYLSLATVGAVSIILTNVLSLGAGLAALLSFSGVIAAALLISWGAEAAQFHVSKGFAIAFIAFLQVLPEFMVEADIAWKQDIPLMFANATGSNRILIGLGWTLIFFTTDVSSRLRGRGGIRHVALARENIVEVLALALSSSYYLIIIAKQSLAIYDTFILGGQGRSLL